MQRPSENVPRYKQLKEYITRGIESGDWPADSKIESENELCRKFGISRMTAHRALRELTETGILYRVQGLGTFVAERKPESSFLEIRNIADEIRSRGHRYGSRLIVQNEIAADRHVCRKLELPAGARVFHTVIIHFENDQPVQYEERFVNRGYVPGYLDADFTAGTPNEYLCEAAPLSEAENVIEAVLADAAIAEALAIRPGDPCLLINRRTWSSAGLVCYARLIHPGGRYRISGRFKA